MSSTAERITLPQPGDTTGLMRVLREAKGAATEHVSVDKAGGDLSSDAGMAMIEDNVWASHPTLLTYSHLMSTMHAQLISVGTSLYNMVRARGP